MDEGTADSIFKLGRGNLGALEVRKNVTQFGKTPFFSNQATFWIYFGQFLQPPAWDDIQAEPSLAKSLWGTDRQHIHNTMFKV